MGIFKIVRASTVFGMPTRQAARDVCGYVVLHVNTLAGQPIHSRRLCAKPHVSNSLFQCRSAGHSLQ